MQTYTGVVHMHSTYSYDGTLSLSELKVLLQERGISWACMTEHTDELTPDAAAAFVAECRALSDESFVFVPGFEVPYQRAHVLMIGCTEFYGQVATSGKELRAWAHAASLVVLAHPIRNHFIVDDVLLSVLAGVEIWNQQYDGKLAPRFRSVSMAEQLREQKPLLVTGGLDLHRSEHFGSPQTTIELEVLCEEHILTALAKGAYRFGSASITITAWQAWEPTVRQRILGMSSRFVIACGKKVNATLKALRIPRPKWLARLIRKIV